MATAARVLAGIGFLATRTGARQPVRLHWVDDGLADKVGPEHAAAAQATAVAAINHAHAAAKRKWRGMARTYRGATLDDDSGGHAPLHGAAAQDTRP